MAKKNYAHIPAVGQLDNMACWAACLKWWFKATKSVKKSQKKLIAKYNYLTDEYGAMSNDTMKRLLELNHIKKEVYDPARRFTSEALWQHLKKGPVFVAFTETKFQSKHVNVIFDIAGTAANPTLSVMEPQAKENPDLTYEGKHMIKSLSEFNQMGTVIIGSL